MNSIPIRHTIISKLICFLSLATILFLFYAGCGGGFQGDNKNADTFETTIFHPEELDTGSTDN